jgi:cytoskeleton protein RodZ
VDAAEDADKVAPRSLGQTLAAERERQGLARTDVAQRLHMSAYQIEAVETGDYSRLPRGTFLRGFVRNYAKALGIAPDPLLALLPEGAPSEKKPGIVVPTQNIRFDPIQDRLANPYVKAAALAFVAVAVGFAAMYWWLFIRPTGAVGRKPPAEAVPLAIAPQAIAERKAPAAPPPVLFEAPKPEPPRKAEPARAEVAKAEAARTESAKSEPAPDKIVVGSGGSVLKFRFKGPSWVEIRDARGKLLLSKLNAPGSEAEVSGRPPFNVIVGNAPEVQLFYNDHEFDLEPHTKVAVARFTVE